ncbi:MAG: hypothetical protein AABY07_02685, partial [Nanoarchaeota archaeon]
TFANYFFHSTARQAVGQFKNPTKNVNNLGKLMLLNSVITKSANFSWPAPKASFPPPFDLTDSAQATLAELIKNSIPNENSIKEERTKFLNPTPQGVGRESVVQNPGGGIR